MFLNLIFGIILTPIINNYVIFCHLKMCFLAASGAARGYTTMPLGSGGPRHPPSRCVSVLADGGSLPAFWQYMYLWFSIKIPKWKNDVNCIWLFQFDEISKTHLWITGKLQVTSYCKRFLILTTLLSLFLVIFHSSLKLWIC